MVQEDRRRHPRYPLVIRVAHMKANAYQYYYSRDVSAGGMFLDTREPFREGEIIELSFRLPTSSTRAQIEGKVARVFKADPEDHESEAGMGIEFVNLDPTFADELRSYLDSL